ncbi:unnamed protein product, partial [Cyprideis torosa]
MKERFYGSEINQKTIFDHPTGLFVLFFTEMWERFSYYGMRALLVLFLTSSLFEEGWAWVRADALLLFGFYAGLVYLTPIFGGLLADKLLGFRRAVVLGALIMTLGHASMAVETPVFFYLGLVLLIIGNGLFKPNISSIVGKLYRDEKQKDAGYTIFYMGINAGAFFGILLCGYLGEKVGWSYGFGLAGIFMFLGLLQFWLAGKVFGDIGSADQDQPMDDEYTLVDQPLSDSLEDIQKVSQDKVQRDRIIVIGNKVAEKIIEAKVVEFKNKEIEVPASWFGILNSFFIIILAPLFSAIWRRFPKTPGSVKFAFGLILLGFGFGILAYGGLDIEKGAKEASVSMQWLVLAYLFHTLGELCLSPVGLSYISKLSPKNLIGVMFGVWFLANFVSNTLAGVSGSFIDTISNEYSISGFFLIFTIVPTIAGLILLALTPMIKRLMH